MNALILSQTLSAALSETLSGQALGLFIYIQILVQVHFFRECFDPVSNIAAHRPNSSLTKRFMCFAHRQNGARKPVLFIKCVEPQNRQSIAGVCFREWCFTECIDPLKYDPLLKEQTFYTLY